ncbi:MBL fold metallo-hydrolase [Actinokineospora globicatena]|uniref:MBL fold metallo-hydrolase n=1 Tax=Actinokineospora globicatena TaxID=103729 RepID=UPI0020A3B78D|nr:MBL fold metallo-hydrolase [Actinokineospora globicatena]MCP2302231.1 L-ascorbate metabolism protein UlaG, beta-lactamase superfamily [Actinokineospora globicatena]GLW76105.1 Zn-dependent hydrolase [Actinokineospora globicatena]GLW82940.1 Zn-dependent hydrolase [Actinokineospora globicatena]
MKRVLTALAVTAAAAAWVAWDVPVALGRRPRGDRVTKSPQYRDGAFRNQAPATPPGPDTMRDTLRAVSRNWHLRKPAGPIPVVEPLGPVDTGLHITWYGHATSLVELDGARVLLDPVWSDRVSPSRLVGPRRLHAPPQSIEALPRLDAVVISHDHYDHLDLTAIRALVRTQDAPFVVPLGIGAHLERWHVPADRIIELDWHESVDIGEVTLTATPAQHFSGRGFKRDGTLWASWVVASPKKKVFYTGDSGYFAGYKEIGEQYGPFDATLVQIGAYAPGWPDIHMTPEEGIAAHLDVRGELLIPVHWATFSLAPHPWTDPVDRLLVEAEKHGVAVAIPKPGEHVDVAAPPKLDYWWQAC